MGTINGLVLTFLVNSIWQITLVAGVASLGALWMRNAPARYRHLLWVAALALSLWLPAWSLRSPGPSTGAMHGTLVSAPGSSSLVTKVGEAADSAAKGERPSRPDSSLPARTPTSPAMAAPPHLGTVARASDTSPWWRGILPGRSARISLPSSLVDLVLGCYILCLLCQAAGLWRAWLRTSEIRKSGVAREFPAPAAAIWARCRAAFGLDNVPLLCSSEVAGPLTLGAWRPVIVLPEHAFLAGSSEDLASALCHEIAHLRRRDFLMNLIYELVLFPISFHPAARLVKRRIDETRELACDELAAGRLVDASAYARSLVNLARSISSSPVLARPGYTLGVLDTNILEERVMRLLDQRPRLQPRLAKLLLSTAALFLAVSSVLASAFLLRIDPQGKAEVAVAQDSFLGTWKGAFQGRTYLIVRLKREGGKLGGAISIGNFGIDESGQVKNVKDEPLARFAQPIIDAKFDGETLFLTAKAQHHNDNLFQMRLTGQGSAEIKSLVADVPTGVPVPGWWRIAREPGSPQSGVGPPLANNANSVTASAPPERPGGGRPQPAQPAQNAVVALEPMGGISGGVSGGVVALEPMGGVSGGVSGGVVALEPMGGVSGGVRGGVVALEPMGGVSGGVSSGVVGGVVGGVVASKELEHSAAEERPTRNVSGTVSDPSGARVPNAIISAVNEVSHEAQTTASDDAGEFRIPALPPGRYMLKVKSPGFEVFQGKLEINDRGIAEFQADALVVGPYTEQLGIVLEPSSISQTVEVTAKAPPASAPPPSGVKPKRIRVGGDVQEGKLVESKPPEYPETARASGIQGVVVLEAVISMKGEPLDLRIISSPSSELSQAAIEAVRQWRYRPTLLNGQPIEVVTTITVRFRLST